MLIARQKKETNIAEYILYMYQIEDLIRSYQFDVDRIMNQIVAPQIQDEQLLIEYRTWYEQLSYDMKLERIQEVGHLSLLSELIVELIYLHTSLLSVMNDEAYNKQFGIAHEHIESFRLHSNLKDKHPVEVCFHALYMKLLMRLKNQEISAATENSFKEMTKLLALLTKAYHDMKNGTGSFWNN